MYADLSIVEGFAANGRAAITGRVYPTAKHLESNRIGCVCRVASLLAPRLTGPCTTRYVMATQRSGLGCRLYAVAHEENVGVRVKSVQAWKMKGAKAAEGSQKRDAPAV